MKKKFSNILITLLATIVFFVGTGVNVFDLCCANCAENLSMANSHIDSLCAESTSVDQTDSCCDPKTASDNVNDCTSHHQEHKKHCSVERVSTDIQNSQVNTPVIAPFVWSLLLHSNAVFDMANVTFHKTEQGYKMPIPIPPREYLSLIRILII